MKRHKTPRRRVRCLGVWIGMLVGMVVAIFGFCMFFLTETGAFEAEVAEIPVLRAQADKDVFE